MQHLNLIIIIGNLRIFVGQSVRWRNPTLNGGKDMFCFIREAYHQPYVSVIVIHVALVTGEVCHVIPRA